MIYWHAELDKFYAKSMRVANTLDNVSVLVTRPAHQAQNLCQLIEAQGGEAFRFPTLEIVASQFPERVETIIAQLSQFDMAIFISPNAVDWGMKFIEVHGGMPPELQIAAVGLSSANRLSDYGVKVDIFPQQVFNSEALLQLEPLQSVAGKHIAIFRGEGGRETLADTLRGRGARVEYVECYRRVPPQIDPKRIDIWLNSSKQLVVTVTSREALQNLVAMLQDTQRRRLAKLPIIVVSERHVSFAKQSGFSQIAVADQASDQALLTAVIKWKSTAVN